MALPYFSIKSLRGWHISARLDAAATQIKFDELGDDAHEYYNFGYSLSSFVGRTDTCAVFLANKIIV